MVDTPRGVGASRVRHHQGAWVQSTHPSAPVKAFDLEGGSPSQADVTGL